MQSITIKAKLSGTDDLRRRTLTSDLQLAELKQVVGELFSLPAGFNMLWRDEDNDLVTIDSDADVAEAVRGALSDPKAILRLEVVAATTTTTTEPAEPEPVEPKTPEPEPAAEGPTPPPAPPNFGGFAEMFGGLPGAFGGMFGGRNCTQGIDLEGIAREFEKHRPAFEAQAQEMARQFEEQIPEMARQFEEQIPELEKLAQQFEEQLPAGQQEDVRHKAHGLCGFLRKAAKAAQGHSDKSCGKKKKKGKNNMKFVADESLPDGTEVLPGELIRKEWRVLNNGATTWPEGSHLQHVGSDLFDGSTPSEIPPLQPGEEAQVSLSNMCTPEQPGRYMSHWRLTTPEGHKFGDRLWFDLNVVQPGTPAPAVESALEQEPEEVVAHFGVVCDVTGCNPILGTRYKKFGQDYDLCQEAYEQLGEQEQQQFVAINTPEDAARVAAEENEAAVAEAAVLARLDELEAAELEAAFVEDAARLQAEAEAQQAADAEAEAILEEVVAEQLPVPPPSIPVEWQAAVDTLKNMGFASIAEQMVRGAEGDIEGALEAALAYVPPPPPAPPAAALIRTTPAAPPAPPAAEWADSWDPLLEELEEMGFEDSTANKKAIAEHSGDLKCTVAALVQAERANRN